MLTKNPSTRFWKTLALVLMTCGAVAPAQSTPASHPQYFFYQLVFLRRPANAPPLAPDAASKLQEEHMENIHRLSKEGKLVMAGPLLDDNALSGVFVLKTTSLDEAKQWTQTDPAVQSNSLIPEFHTWIQTTDSFRQPPESNPMEQYALVVYNRGDRFKSFADPKMRTVIGRHLTFLREQRESGKLAVGGPFKDGTGDVLGLMIFAATPEEAKDIVAQDPFVMEGEVRPEVHLWTTQKGVLSK